MSKAVRHTCCGKVACCCSAELPRIKHPPLKRLLRLCLAFRGVILQGSERLQTATQNDLVASLGRKRQCLQIPTNRNENDLAMGVGRAFAKGTLATDRGVLKWWSLKLSMRAAFLHFLAGQLYIQ